MKYKLTALALAAIVALSTGGVVAADLTAPQPADDAQNHENKTEYVNLAADNEDVVTGSAGEDFEVTTKQANASQSDATKHTLSESDFQIVEDSDAVTVKSSGVETMQVGVEETESATAGEDFEVTIKQANASQSDVGTRATYDVAGTLDPDQAHAYGPHSLAAGETMTVDVNWEAAASDFCLGIMDSDGNVRCVVQEDGSGSVTYTAEKSGDYYAFIWNQGPYTSDYSGYYRV